MFAVTVYGGDRNRLPISSVALLTDSPRGASDTEAPLLDDSRKRPPHAAATEGPAFADHDRHVHGKELNIHLHIRVSIQASHRCRPRKAGLRPHNKCAGSHDRQVEQVPGVLRPAACSAPAASPCLSSATLPVAEQVVAGSRVGAEGNAAQYDSISDPQLPATRGLDPHQPTSLFSPLPHRYSQLPCAHVCV